MKTPRRPVLRYFGGKWRLAPWIIGHFPKHAIYVEPFAGAASVLMRKPRSRIEVYNDIDEEVVNVFQVLRDPFESVLLMEQLALTPYARMEYKRSHAKYPSMGEVERARRTIVKSFMGHGADSMTSKHASGFRSKTTNANRHAALDWINYPPEVANFCARLAGVTIEQNDAVKVIKAFDGPETLFYVDPPYHHSTRGQRHRYRNEYTNDQHLELIETLVQCKGMVVLSGYETPEYMAMDWTVAKKDALADGARPRVECLWLNPAAKARL